jgi:hypothetical protein
MAEILTCVVSILFLLLIILIWISEGSWFWTMIGLSSKRKKNKKRNWYGEYK